MPRLAGQDISHPNPLAIESFILVSSLNDDRAINLDPSIEPPALQIIPHGSLSLMQLRLQHATHPHWPRNRTDLPSKRTSDFREGLERFFRVDHHHTIIDIHPDQEPQPGRMQQDPARWTPPAIRRSGDQDPTAPRTTDPQPGPHGGEDGQPFRLFDHLGGDLLHHLGFAPRSPILAIRGGGLLLGLDVEAVLAEGAQDAGALVGFLV